MDWEDDFNRIPAKWRRYWEYVADPPEFLIHVTTRECADQIERSGSLLPRDPAPRDWHGLFGIFLSDPNHATFDGRQKGLLTTHFLKRSTELDVFIIRNPGVPLFRCKDPNRASSFISMRPIAASCAERRPYATATPACPAPVVRSFPDLGLTQLAAETPSP